MGRESVIKLCVLCFEKIEPESAKQLKDQFSDCDTMTIGSFIENYTKTKLVKHISKYTESSICEPCFVKLKAIQGFTTFWKEKLIANQSVAIQNKTVAESQQMDQNYEENSFQNSPANNESEPLTETQAELEVLIEPPVIENGTFDPLQYMEKNTTIDTIVDLTDSNDKDNSEPETEPAQVGKLTCSTCEQKFNTTAALGNHERLHKPSLDRQSFCDKCSCYFSKEVFKDHDTVFHVKPKKAEPYTCDKCNRSFTLQIKFKKHVC